MIVSNDMVKKLKEEYGDAFYLLDSEQFRKNFKELKAAFSAVYPNFNIAYSYKTNYTPKLCKIVDELGGYAEVVSEMELELALRIGVSHERIIWNGPTKNKEYMEKFLLSGGTVNIDSIDEALLIKEMATNHCEKVLNVGLRCNYDVKDGVISRFGFDIESNEFKQALEIVTNTDNIKFINLHCHFAKRQIDYWPARAKGMVDLIDRICIIPDRVDIGGGLFGKMVKELEEQFSFKIPNYSDYAEAAAKVFADRFAHEVKKPELIIEPGSALVGDCMKFVGTVMAIKKVRGKAFATVLGSQKNISMGGVNPPIEILHLGIDTHEYENMDIVGFTCIEGDVLYKGYNGPLSVGDVIVISNCGSYSIVMKPPFILPNFPIIDPTGNKVELIKKKETFDDIFHTYNY
ncbi:MAG: hypothetical protein Q4P09_07500 [Phascolarctobacterium sp.]|nr:hypothetical protein [Phascolarctobacterium sp.]